MVAATVAAANLTFTYLLFAVERPGISIAAYMRFRAIGSAPFLLTAGRLAWVITGAGQRLGVVAGAGGDRPGGGPSSSTRRPRPLISD